MSRGVVAWAGLAVLLVAGSARAQGIPNPQQVREEIARRVKELVDASPEVTVEQGHLQIVYKQVPCDPIQIAKDSLPPGTVPAGFDPTPLMGQFGPAVAEELGKHLDAIGTLTARAELKIGTTRIKEGAYRLGLLFDEEEALVLGLALTPLDEAGEVKVGTKPINLELKVYNRREAFATHLELTVPESEKTKGKFAIVVTFFKADTRTKAFEMETSG